MMTCRGWEGRRRGRKLCKLKVLNFIPSVCACPSQECSACGHLLFVRIAAEAVLGSNCYFSLQNKIKMEKHILCRKGNMIKGRSRSQLLL